MVVHCPAADSHAVPASLGSDAMTADLRAHRTELLRTLPNTPGDPAADRTGRLGARRVGVDPVEVSPGADMSGPGV